MGNIAAADDGSEPMKRSWHNLVDPTPDEIMACMTELKIAHEEEIKKIKNKINEILSASFNAKLEKVEDIE